MEIAIKTDISSLKAWAYFEIGCCYGELKYYTKAIEAFKQAIRINPDDADTHYNLGIAYDLIGLYKDAIKAYKQVIYINPDYNAHVYIRVGGISFSYRLYKDAIEAFKQAIRIDPDNVDAHYGLGVYYSLIGDKTSALNEYKILKELNIDLANELFDLIY